MFWLLGILAAVGVVWGLSPARPYMNPIPDAAALREGLRTLLNQGVHNSKVKGTLTLCIKDDKDRKLIFTKYIAHRDVGFRAVFGREPWAELHFDAFRAELNRRGVKYRETRESGLATLTFDLGRDYGGAYVVARTLFEDTLGVRLHHDCVMYTRDVLVRNIPRATGVERTDEF